MVHLLKGHGMSLHEGVRHPVLQAYIDDVDRASVLIARWATNRAGHHIATREELVASELRLDELLAAAGTIDGPSADFLRAFVVYRGALEEAQTRLHATPAWLDNAPHRLIATREARGMLLARQDDWERAPGEAAAFLADWAPGGDCPTETTDLWSSGLRQAVWTHPRLDPNGRLPARVGRALVRSGNPEHPFRPDLAAVFVGAGHEHPDGPAMILTRPCGDEWHDGQYLEQASFREAVYLVANHGGDLRREPLPDLLAPLEEAAAPLQKCALSALGGGRPADVAV